MIILVIVERILVIVELFDYTSNSRTCSKLRWQVMAEQLSMVRQCGASGK